MVKLFALAMATLVAADPKRKGAARTHRTREISTDIGKGIHTFEFFFREIDADNISQHGCWCAKMANDFGTGGEPVDEADSICRDWYKARRCLLLEGGACSAGVDFDEYKTAGIYYQNPMERWCHLAQDNPCMAAMCVVDYTFAQKLKELGRFPPMRNAQCSPTIGNGAEMMCEGEAPDVKLVPVPYQCEDVPANPRRLCGWLVSDVMPNETYYGGSPWPFDVARIWVGSGKMTDIGGFLTSRGQSNVTPVVDFTRRTRSILERRGCTLTLFATGGCTDRGYTARDCEATGMSYQDPGYNFCESLGAFNDRAVYYTCTCGDERAVVGEEYDNPNPWNF